jgi:hypothetical protein
MKFRIIIREGEAIPPFYGIGRIDFISQAAICYLVPFNKIIALTTWMYYWLIQWHPTALDLHIRRLTQEAYKLGRQEGELIGKLRDYVHKSNN